jgi:hypothetical protein
VKASSSITANTETAPDGTATADTITASAVFGNAGQLFVGSATALTLSV